MANPVLKSHKVLLFSEFAETARYVHQELASAGITGIERVDGATSGNDRVSVIRRFATIAPVVRELIARRLR